jgi:PHD/YefM family antitoxin component YafN of YafNO toxin-antitoxin module
MKPSRIKPISQLRARGLQMLHELAQSREPIVITINGNAMAVLQDIASYEERQDALALLKILALTSRTIEEGRVTPAHKVFARLRRLLPARRCGCRARTTKKKPPPP